MKLNVLHIYIYIYAMFIYIYTYIYNMFLFGNKAIDMCYVWRLNPIQITIEKKTCKTYQVDRIMEEKGWERHSWCDISSGSLVGHWGSGCWRFVDGNPFAAAKPVDVGESPSSWYGESPIFVYAQRVSYISTTRSCTCLQLLKSFEWRELSQQFSLIFFVSSLPVPEGSAVSFRMEDVRVVGKAKPVCTQEYDGCRKNRKMVCWLSSLQEELKQFDIRTTGHQFPVGSPSWAETVTFM